MKIIGCDFHPSFQQIAVVDTETGEHTERRLTPSEAIQFYSRLKGKVLVGMDGCGNTLWFERLLADLGHELWLGDAGKIRALEVRKQKTDRRDAELLLRLLEEGRFPRLWVPNQEQRDLRLQSPSETALRLEISLKTNSLDGSLFGRAPGFAPGGRFWDTRRQQQRVEQSAPGSRPFIL